MEAMPRLSGRVPTRSSGLSPECFFGWKLALAKLWRSIGDLMGEHQSFRAALQALNVVTWSSVDYI
jgi:hypothetical protein